ncbi:hypothetical protein HEQ72_08565 [Haematospirillum sp. 15-248]|uniref:hypothetical protein n=1 Tax=Haematospirillum sp. 15-248 TaxID=2723107 RepID=UPI00143C467D|nr:hypothetical protein [Haematospirillum sp. 15-248]NKD88361.1 hypothetical protein [Haematospirillum sp. 15-248]
MRGRGFLVSALMLAGTILSACGDVPRPFSHVSGGASAPLAMLPGAFGVAVPPVKGLPAPQDRQAAEDMVHALRIAGIPAFFAPHGIGYTFRGEAEEYDVGALRWSLSGPDGADIERITQNPDQDRASVVAAVVPLLEREVGSHSPHGNGPSGGSGDVVLRVVIRGLPDTQGRLLQRAMEVALRQDGIPVQQPGDVASPGSDVLTVTGTLSHHPVSDKGKGKSLVRMAWYVEDSSGQSPGTVTQENVVPDAALKARFPALAVLIAQGGSAGVLDVLDSRKASVEAVRRSDHKTGSHGP